MPRNLPIGLQEALKRSTLETHSTLELTLFNDATGADTYYFATARLTINGVLHSPQLRNTEALKSSLTRSVDRTSIDLQNVDTILGIDLVNAADSFYGARVRFGRYWRDYVSGAVFHKYLLTGAVVGVDVNEQVARLGLVSDAYAALNVGAYQPVVRNCRAEVVGGYKGFLCGSTSPLPTCGFILTDCEARHSGTDHRAKFAGYAYIKDQASIAGAVGLAQPASAQLVRTSDGVTTTSYLQQAATTFLGASVTTDAANNQLIVDVTGAGRAYAIHAKADFGAVGDGVTDDTTAIQNAIDSSQLTGRAVYLPASTYYVPGGLTAAGDVQIFGDGDSKTILYSDANVTILDCSAASFRSGHVHSLRIRGDKSAGSSQIGLKVDGPTDMLFANFHDLTIEQCGGSGLYIGTVFSAVFKSIFSDDNEGWAIEIDSANMPALYLENVYPGVISTSHPAGFRIRAGNVTLMVANGVNSVPASAWIAILGKKNGLYGDSSDGAAFAHFIGTNFESYNAGAVYLLRNSEAKFSGKCTFAKHHISTTLSGSINNSVTTVPCTGNLTTLNFPASGTVGEIVVEEGGNIERMVAVSRTTSAYTVTRGTPAFSFTSAATVTSAHSVGLQYDLDTVGNFPALFGRGSIDDECNVQDLNGLRYYYKQAFVHANDIPRVKTQGQGPTISGSSAKVTEFWNTTTTRLEKLFRGDDFMPTEAITGAKTYNNPGPRAIACNFSAGATVTLWSTVWEQHTPRPIIVYDKAGNAASNNITINAAGGESINGGSLTISQNYGAVILMPDYSATGWRVLASYPTVATLTNTYVGVGNGSNILSGSAQLTFDTTTLQLSKAGGNPYIFITDTANTIDVRIGTLAGAPDRGIIGTMSSHPFVLYANGNASWGLDTSGHWLPYGTTNTLNIGSSSAQVASVTLGGSAVFYERSAPSTPAANSVALYAKDKSGVSNLYWKNDAGTEYDLSAAGGGSGDVVGPSSATDNAIARFDSTTGKLIQNSGVSLSDLSSNTYTEAAVAPAVAGTSTAGIHFISRASDAVAGNVTNGAAAGGDWSAIAGDAKRLNTGNANGGNVYLTPGALIGSGSDGQVIIGRNGTGAVPAITWAGATNSGISNFSGGIQFTYAGSNNAAITANGAKFSSNGRVAWSADTTTFGTEDLSIWRHATLVARIGGDNTGAVAGKLFVSRSDKTMVGWLTVDGDTANTNAVADVGAIGLDSTGTAAAGLGAQLQLTLESSTTNQQQAAGITWVWTTATHASRTADLFFSTVNSATVGESFRLVAGGAWRTPAIADPGSPTNGDTWRSSTRNAISTRVSGQTEDFSTTMWRSSAQSSFDTTTTATSVISNTGVGTKTIAADRLVVGNQIRITAGGVYGSKASSAGTLTLRVRTGGTTMLTAVFTIPDGVADQVWSLEAVGALNTVGSSGVIYWRLAWLMTDSSGVVYMMNYTVNSTTINTTTSRVLDITGQFSVSDADNFLQTDNAMIEVLA